MGIISFFKPGSTFCMILLISFRMISLDAQDKSEILSPHYVFPRFGKGTVLMKDGRIQEAVMDYNKLSEEMVFEKGEQRLAMVHLETIDTVFLGGRKFIPHENVFYEVLVSGKVSLLVRHKSNLLPAGTPAGYGGTSETAAVTSISTLVSSGNLYKLSLPGEYHISDATQFWIKRDGTEIRVGNERQFLKIVTEKREEIKDFISRNKLDLKKQEDLIRIVARWNVLLREKND